MPPGFVAGQNALSLGAASPAAGSNLVNWTYIGPTSGSQAELVTAIHSASNWTGVRTALNNESPANFQNSINFPTSFNVGAPAPPAEINLRGNGVNIADGDTTPSYADGTSFGGTAVTGGTVAQTFTIQNQGGQALSIGAISITGVNASDFTVTANPAGSVAGSGQTTFTVTFNPSAAGLRTASISIVNGDVDESPYNFDVRGSGIAAAPTALAAGDIAFVGFNGDTTSTTFGFVLLKAVVAGTVIKFTDSGWTGSALATNESAVQWVAPTNMAFGTVIQFNEADLGANFQTTSDGGYFAGTRFHLESSGDQIFAYTGSASSPTFLGGLHTDSSTFDATYTNGSSSSRLPPTLTDGGTAISFGNGATNYYSGVYAGSPTGDQAALLAKINNEANWVGSANPQTIPSGTFGSGSAAPEIEVQYQVGSVSIADGDTTPVQTDGTQFDHVNVSGGSQSHTFVIRNLGDQTLNLGTVTVSGANASDFTYTLGSTTVGASQSTTLTVTFDPSAAGARTATITIPSNDADEASYDFAVRGLGRDPAQTLAAGDIAFAGYDAVDDQFAFVLLRDVAAGTSIKFTDGGWTGSTYRPAEGAVEWTAASALTAGTVVTYDGTKPNGGPDWTPIDTAYFTSAFNPDIAGDQIIAYQGTASAGGAGLMNLAALYYDKTAFDTSYADNIGSSLLPTGLVDGQTAISFGKPDNVSAYRSGTYTGPTNLPFPQQLAALNNEANWTGSDNDSTFPAGPIGVAPNQPPTLTSLAGDSVSFTEGGTAVLLDAGSNAIVADATSPDFSGGTLTVTITANEVASEDVLGIRTSATVTLSAGLAVGSTVGVGGTQIGTITAAGTGGADLVVSLNASANAANLQTVVRALTYSNSNADNPSTPARSIAVTLSDGDGGTSTAAVVTATVTAVNDAPVLVTNAAGALAYTENDAATAVAPGLTLSDVDSANLTGAMVSIMANFALGDDVLTFTSNAGTGSITGSYDAITGMLTLSGSGTQAQYQAALDAVTYANTSNNPSTATRTVSFVATDGTDASIAVTRNISITAVNDAPIARDDAASALQRAAAVTGNVLTDAPADSDADGNTLAVTQVSLGGVATAVAAVGTTQITGKHGVLTIAADGSYSYSASVEGGVTVGGTAVDDFTYTISDGQTGTATAHLQVTVTGSATGNAGVNVFLLTGPGTSAEGLGGDDSYFVDGLGDTVTEAAGGGNDTVFASGSFTLAAGQEVEVLRTYVTTSGLTLTGNERANTLLSGAGNDTLSGGAGNDTLLGFGGDDSFLFETALDPATNIDTIIDFANVGGNNDTIWLENAIFTALTTVGTLVAGAFQANADGMATEADDRIILESDTGKLFYDADGSDGGAALQFAAITNYASLTGATALSAADFYVV